MRDWGFGPILYRRACYIRGEAAGRRNYFFIYKLRGAAGRRPQDYIKRTRPQAAGLRLA